MLTIETKILPDGSIKKISKLVVHTFSVDDVEDPDLYASEPLYKWEKSEAGQYVMAKAIETPIWQRHNDVSSFSTQYAIIAKLYEEDITYFTLRFK